MPVFIRYEYQIAGEADIKRSMSSVASHAEKENNRTLRAQTRARQTSAGAANSNASVREAEKAETARLKAAEKADKLAARSAEKEHNKAEREKTKITDREAKERARIEEQWSQKQARLKEQHFRDVARRERDEERQTARHRASLYNTTRSVTSGTVRRVSNIASGASMVAGIGGVMLATNALHEGMKVEKSSLGLANQMAKPDETPEQIKKRAEAITKQVDSIKGATSSDLITGAREFGGISGSYAVGLRAQQQLNEIALATDVDLASLSKVAGGTYQKIKTPEMSEDEALKQTLETVRTFAGQGNVGAVEIKDLAQYGNRLTSGAMRFKGTRIENMKSMGSLAQVAAGFGATDAAEATEAAIRFADDLSTHADKFGELKLNGKRISAFTDPGVGPGKNTQMRGIRELVGDAIQATGGSQTMLGEIFGMRSKKMTDAFAQKYTEAEAANAALAPEKRQAKGKAGRAAIDAEFDKFDKAALTEKDQALRAEAALTGTTAQLDEAMKKMNTSLATELLPVMPGLIHSFSELAKPLADIVSKAAAVASWLAANPFGGFSALISASLLNELARAKIGSIIRGMLTGQGSAPSPALSGMNGMGKLGAGLAAVGVGAAAYSVTAGLLDLGGDTRAKDSANATQRLSETWEEYSSKRSAILAGKGTDEEKGKQLQALTQNTGANVNLIKESQSGFMSKMPDWFRSVFDTATAKEADKGVDEMQKRITADQLTAAKMLQNAAEKLASGASSPGGGATPNRGNSPSPVKG
jgi:hypothetical protein